MHEILDCGCSAIATHAQAHNGLGPNHPSCFIHDCCSVKMNQPDLKGRKARCAYHGKLRHKNECSVCSKRDDSQCMCERDSSTSLPFFVYQPDKRIDEFYCGCHSWD